MMVGMKRISTAFGLLVAMASVASAQEVAVSQNQSTANAVAGTLRSSRNLAGYRIEIMAREGLVTLRGALETPAQKAEAIARTRYINGVRGVVDELRVTNDTAVSPVRYQPGGGMMHGGGYAGGPTGGGIQYGNTTGPMSGGMSYGAGSAPVYDGSPVPEGPAGMPGASQAAQPGYPNYAWPSYAPYPNFSAVGYPTAYPWQAWPNIGPFSPYPEVPLDWRAVTLRWDDGIWWLDFKKHYTRPFFTPYPFGLFAY
jgi:BON domain